MTDWHWCSVPPKDGESQSKVVDGISYKWCAKCRHWVTTHTMATHTGVKRNANKGSHGNHLSTALPHPSPSSTSTQANLFLDLDPATWVMSIESLTFYDFLCALVAVVWMILLPILAISFVMSLRFTNMVDYLVLASTPVVHWILAHPLLVVPPTFWVLLLASIFVLKPFSWFHHDPYPLPHWVP